MRTAAWSPAAGISGDMTLGALLALGVPQDWLEAPPAPLGLRGGGGTGPGRPPGGRGRHGSERRPVRRGVQAGRVHDPGATARTTRGRAGAPRRASAGVRLGEA